MLIKLTKDKRLIAVAEKVISSATDHPHAHSLFYFYRVSLSPPVMFEHLAGKGLFGILDRCNLVIDDGKDKMVWHDLRYVHGRSEAMKGEHEVTSVLLAAFRPDTTISEAEWLTQLPKIYMNFQRTLK